MKKQKPFKLRKGGYKKKPGGKISIGLGVNLGSDDFPEAKENPYIIIDDEFIPLNDDRLEKKDSEPGDPKISEP